VDVVVERPGALDVHKAKVTAAVRLPPAEGKRRRRELVAEFATTVPGLMRLADWLAERGVRNVAMEATGDYWKPVWAVLEERFELMLVNAQHVKQVPGRKTDIKDAQWLCRLLEAGLLRPSLVPAAPMQALRELTRYRKTRIHERQREIQRLHKVLEDTGIKLATVATDILGVSGRLMLEALVAGTTDPDALADLARGRLRSKLPALREALHGRFRSEHALLVRELLGHVDYLNACIDRLSADIAERLREFDPAIELLCTIPGVQRRSAEVILAETGGDMSAFPTARHLASWAAMCPGNDESAGKRRSGKTRKGSKWLRAALCESAHAAARTRGSYLQAQYNRLRVRRGPTRAVVAVGHSILIAVWHILTTGEIYRDLGGDYFQRRDPARLTRRLVAQLERLGHTVTLTTTEGPAVT
jgi:transposase